jgi:hypothetical protein
MKSGCIVPLHQQIQQDMERPIKTSGFKSRRRTGKISDNGKAVVKGKHTRDIEMFSIQRAAGDLPGIR